MPRGDSNTYIATYSGGFFWPLDPHPDDIKIEDIAHSLSLQCRWTGHVRQHYSVGQHSILASQLVSAPNMLWALLHDASEAYLVDLARPVKRAQGLGEIYLQVEKNLERIIATKFGLPSDIPEEVRKVDSRLLITEKRDLMNGTWVEPHADGELTPYEFTIVPWKPKLTEEMFLERYYGLI